MSVFPSEHKNSSEFVCFFMCSQSALQTESVNMPADDDKRTLEFPTSPCNGTSTSKRTWDYNVPELSIMGVEDRQMPEMPNLESVLGNSLQSVRPRRTVTVLCF